MTAPGRPRYGWDSPARLFLVAAMRRRGDPILDILAYLRSEGYDLAPSTLGRQLPALGITLPDTVSRAGRRTGGVTPRSNGTVPTYDAGAYQEPILEHLCGSDTNNAPEKDFTSDKKVAGLDWRAANRVIGQMQDLKDRARGSQDHAVIDFGHLAEPICILPLSDGHFGSMSTDHETLARITDEILSIPNLYVAVLGDMLQMSIKLRSVLEVSDNLLTPAMQLQYLASWLAEIEHKVLFSTWDNHSSERMEKQAGIDAYGEIFKRRCVFYSGIGHADVRLGDQTYTFAVSHVFRGRSMYNPTHSQARYARMEAPDREIIMAGDSHVPAMAQFVEGGMLRTAINGGAAQSGGYARRYFSLKTWACWPVVVIDPHQHLVTPYWSIQSWLNATGQT